MNSIRHKLFFQIGSLMLLFILLLYLANTFLLETFYLNSTKQDLKHIYETINKLDQTDYSKDFLYQLTLETKTNVSLAIIDPENGILYTPQNPFVNEQLDTAIHSANKLPPPKPIIVIKEEFIDENNKFKWIKEVNIGFNFLMYEGTLDNGMKIDIRTPLSSVNKNITILNQYTLIVGVIIFIASMIAANIISKHFTHPILNIFNVTNSIRKMDFSKSCEVITNDEIGRLAKNINEMSYALKENIDDLAKSNQQLTSEIQERVKIDEQRKALLNNVSHELKTPLSLVQGYSEGLKLNLHKSKDKTDFYCDVIIDEAKKMDLLVSQLLDINHLQFGDFPLHKEPTDAYEFLSYIIKKYDKLIGDADITFGTDLSAISNKKHPVQLHIDSLRSEQVLTNLLNNALAYVNEQKEIAIKTEYLESTNTTRNPLNHSHLRITISNSHEEVSPENLKQWWNSFYKEDQARTRENGGYGLGLSIIKAIQESDSNLYGVYYESGFINLYIDFDITVD